VLSGESRQTVAVLANVTAGGKYKALDPGAAGGSELAAGILYVAVDALRRRCRECGR
jgi:Bacteriophage lambda head decoration protein D